jgi:16S rRNA processing protein RimM
MGLWTLQNPHHIGDIIKTHGYLGKIKVAFLFSDYDKIIVKDAFIFIKLFDIYVPFQIIDFQKSKDNEGIITLLGIDSEEKAKNLIKREIYLSEADLSKTIVEELNEEMELLHYQVITDTGISIGIVIEEAHNGAHPLLVIDNKGREIFIPYLDDFIIHIDEDKEIVTVTLPEGYLDI